MQPVSALTLHFIPRIAPRENKTARTTSATGSFPGSPLWGAAEAHEQPKSGGKRSLRRQHVLRQPVAMDWAQIAPVLRAEASLCDIYVFDASLDDWANVWSALLADSDNLSFTVDGEPAKPPPDVAEAFRLGRNHAVCGSYIIGKQRLNCHFFVEEEVEFDCDPRDVDGPAEADRLAEFITMLGHVTSKEVRLTPENGPDEVIARYEPATGQFVWMPAGA